MGDLQEEALDRGGDCVFSITKKECFLNLRVVNGLMLSQRTAVVKAFQFHKSNARQGM